MDGRDILLFMGASVLALVVLITPIVLLCNWGEESQCANVAALMNAPYVYGFNTPCMIQRDGQWEPLYRAHRRD